MWIRCVSEARHYEGDLSLPQRPAEDAPNEEWDEWYSHGDYDGEATEDTMLALAEALNVPKLVAVAIIYENDDYYKTQTLEGRYNKLLAWTRRWITRDCSTWTTKNMEGYVE